MKRPLAALVAASALVAAPAAAQYCPSYTASSPNNTHACAIEAFEGSNPSDGEWLDIFHLVAQGPDAWGDQGPSVTDIGQGCGKPEEYHAVTATFPCELLMAIAMVETKWLHFCVPTTPSDQVGGAERTIISFDCGYGIAQVTSGMHVGETPDFDRDRVAYDPIYNLATGTRILAAKWKATQCVGDNQPGIVEHWYTSTWAYNGLAYKNNPNNPDYDPARDVYDPQIGGSAPYQEKVFGYVEHDPKWSNIELAYPNPGDIGGGSSPPELPEPSCASPTNCVDTRELHESNCGAAGGAGGSGGSGGGGVTVSSSSSGVGGDGGSDDPGLQGIPGGDAGCGCITAGSGTNRSGWLVVGLVLLACGRRRRTAA